jgi:cytochrome b561
MQTRIEGDGVSANRISLSEREATSPVYDKTTIRLHWATASLVVLLWLMGRTTGFLPRGPLRLDIWSLHVVLGFVLAGIVLTRIIWRVTRGHRLPPSDRGIRHLLAVTTHLSLYVLLLIVVVLGILNVFAHAFPLFNVWQFPRIGSGHFQASVNHWHNVAANVIAVLALFHAVAALFHHYVMRDGILHRMRPAELRQSRNKFSEKFRGS